MTIQSVMRRCPKCGKRDAKLLRANRLVNRRGLIDPPQVLYNFQCPCGENFTYVARGLRPPGESGQPASDC